MQSVEERGAAGKALRKNVPRSSQADFLRDPSLDPVDLLLSQEKGRIRSLIPVRRQRMSESAFAFYRAGALLMATDLASTPRTGLLVQCSGDAHVSNFGWYGSPERDLVFDANDFDETMLAAWEWDLKRLVASFVIASQDNGFKKKHQRSAASSASTAYRDAMNRFASMSVLDTWYAHVNADDMLKQLESEGRSKAQHRAKKAVGKASSKDSSHVLGKIGEKVNGHWRIADDPPFVVPIRSMDFPEEFKNADVVVQSVVGRYRDSVRPAIRSLIAKFEVKDVALKVVGVGSVGTRCFIALLEGNTPDDVLFLQIKQAESSVLENEFGMSVQPYHGQRVVEGQRLMQASSDIMLGWTEAATGHEYYVRQLKDMKASPKLENFDPDDMTKYARVCGAVLAHAHARSGDPVMIAGYIGSGDVFADAVAEFGVAYAAQNAEDYRAFLDRMKEDPPIVT
ncbi:MAG: DUF2252 domain-containing protein [Actinomycetia bacterium]|nr:DUF2252 domain-containing protein [Actinomycetes bacterium]